MEDTLPASIGAAFEGRRPEPGRLAVGLAGFRDPPPPGGVHGPGARRSGPSPGDEWLDARDIEAECALAEQEIAAGLPDAAVRRLAELAPRTRDEWGVRRPLVGRVWRLAADGLRLAGDCGTAAVLYDGLARYFVPGDAAEARAERAVLRLRGAECRRAFGEIDGALAALEESETVAARLPAHLAAQVAGAGREVAVDVSERRSGPAARR